MMNNYPLAKRRVKKIVVAMSGGVDSSMSLMLLKKQGWQPIGVSLKLPVWMDKRNLLRENICCTKEALNIAKRVCKKLNVPHYIFNVEKEFKKEVIDYFITELRQGRTPNPCIICNRYLKFKKLFEWAKKHNVEYIATGHYARVRKNPKTSQYELLRSKDTGKDQTYTLCFLSQEWLRHIIFPLGDFTKEEIYQMAKDEGFDIFKRRRESQDFCFVAGKSLNHFLQKEIGKKRGLIKDTSGDTLGEHQGLHFYTIGQRKGIGLSGGPYYVVGMDVSENALIVSKNKDDLYRKEVLLSPCHFIAGTCPKNPIHVQIKIRYGQSPAKATLLPISKDKMKLVFDKPQRAVTPGQFAVFYKQEICLGGGRIL